ncbi:MAG: hypothetical protein R3315_04225 [Woeseiaceae bacterium]|nr:hypothetical protein [Woeseiaceae bacterium]
MRNRLLMTEVPGVAAALVAIGLIMATPVSADSHCAESGVTSLDFTGIESGFSGSARLCHADNGLKGDLSLSGLTPGNAYTVWWVYIDQPPAGCDGSFFACIETLFGDNPLMVFGRMDSGIGPANGKDKYSDRLDDMTATSGSVIWLLALGHGEASDDGRQLARQLLTPEDPNAGFPHLGVELNGYPVAMASFVTP